MKSNLTNLLFICNIVVFIINDLSVHFIIFLKALLALKTLLASLKIAFIAFL